MASSLQVAACCCFLLLITCICMAAARADPPTPSSVQEHNKKHLLQGGGRDTAGVGGKLQSKGMEQQDESCDGEDECLMRRTLVAHTDYIYTQGKHN